MSYFENYGKCYIDQNSYSTHGLFITIAATTWVVFADCWQFVTSHLIITHLRYLNMLNLRSLRLVFTLMDRLEVLL